MFRERLEVQWSTRPLWRIHAAGDGTQALPCRASLAGQACATDTATCCELAPGIDFDVPESVWIAHSNATCALDANTTGSDLRNACIRNSLPRVPKLT